ncbi:protein of unknown function [Aminobacter niigataensis]|nr:protein of unknown function [Aminobacter niigataensis]
MVVNRIGAARIDRLEVCRGLFNAPGTSSGIYPDVACMFGATSDAAVSGNSRHVVESSVYAIIGLSGGMIGGKAFRTLLVASGC